MPAPNISRSALATALRADDDDSDIAGQLDRILETAIALVSSVTDAAPQSVANEATIRIGAWLYDSDAASPRNGDPLRASGAAQLLSRWRSDRAGEPGRGRLMGWFTNLFVEPETRQASYTDQVVAAIVASASGAGSHDVGLTAAAEIARSQWGRAFAAARSDVLLAPCAARDDRAGARLTWRDRFSARARRADSGGVPMRSTASGRGLMTGNTGSRSTAPVWPAHPRSRL